MSSAYALANKALHVVHSGNIRQYNELPKVMSRISLLHKVTLWKLLYNVIRFSARSLFICLSLRISVSVFLSVYLSLCFCPSLYLSSCLSPSVFLCQCLSAPPPLCSLPISVIIRFKKLSWADWKHCMSFWTLFMRHLIDIYIFTLSTDYVWSWPRCRWDVKHNQPTNQPEFRIFWFWLKLQNIWWAVQPCNIPVSVNTLLTSYIPPV